MMHQRILAGLLVIAAFVAGVSPPTLRMYVTITGLFLGLLFVALVIRRDLPKRGVMMERHGPIETGWFRSVQFVLWSLIMVQCFALAFGLMSRFNVIGLGFNYDSQAFTLPLGVLTLLGAWYVLEIREEYGGAKVHAPGSAWLVWTLALVGFLGTALVAYFVLGGSPPTLGAEPLQEREMSFLALGTATALTAAFMTRGSVPGMYRLLVGVSGFEEEPEQVEDAPPYLYAALVAASSALLLGAALYWTGFLDLVASLIGSVESAYILTTGPLIVLLFFLYARIRLAREVRRGLYRKKLEVRVVQAIVVFSIAFVLGTLSSILAYLALTGQDLSPLPSGYNGGKDFMTAALVLSLGPIGLFLARENRRIDGFEDRLPDFLEDLAESRRAGLTLPNALESCAHNDYGPLSFEVTRMRNQLRWGLPFTDVFAGFGERVRSNLVKRSVRLVIEASQSGGNVADILKAAARDARDLKGLEHERRVNLSTYLIVIYVTYFVFLFVLATLDAQFIPQVEAAQLKLANSQLGQSSDLGGINPNVVDVLRLDFTFFTAAFVQAIGNGIVGGILVERRVSAGLRHVAFMAVGGWITFRLIIPVMVKANEVAS